MDWDIPLDAHPQFSVLLFEMIGKVEVEKLEKVAEIGLVRGVVGV